MEEAVGFEKERKESGSDSPTLKEKSKTKHAKKAGEKSLVRRPLTDKGGWNAELGESNRAFTESDKFGGGMELEESSHSKTKASKRSLEEQPMQAVSTQTTMASAESPELDKHVKFGEDVKTGDETLTKKAKRSPKIKRVKDIPGTMAEPDAYSDQAKDLVDHVVSNAKEMIDDVISSAFRRLETRMSEREKTCESLKTGALSKESTFISRDENFELQDIGWLTIQEFSVEKAEEKINEYIKTWEYENSWLYCVDFLGEDIHPYDKRYRFRVRWSIPTRRKPVPRATASVYFTFVVSTIKPKHYPVDVFYVFETNRLVHRPGQSRFREKWLKDIIESKVSMMAAVRF